MLQTINGTTLGYELEEGFVKYSREASSYLDRVKEINLLPFSNLEIFFSDDIWDFSQSRTVNICKSLLSFRFTHTCEHYRDDIKKYVLSMLLDGRFVIQNVQREYLLVSHFLNYAFEMAYYNIHQIDADLVSNFIQRLNGKSKSYKLQYASCLKKFISYYSVHYEDIYTAELEALLDPVQYRLSKREIELRKTSDVPQHYFNNFLKAAIAIIDSSDVPNLIKAGTCVLMILSQTGLRISEALDLKCGTLLRASSYSGKELYYLNYRTWKRERGNNVFATEKTFANALTQKAYGTLMELYDSERRCYGYEYLYLGAGQNRELLDLPVSCDRFGYTTKHIFSYMNHYFPTINVPFEHQKDLSTCDVTAFPQMRGYYPNAKTLTYPNTKQFRVHVCSELYARGCPLEYIQKFMGHLSNEMMGYYVRTKPHNTQEDIEYALEIFKTIVSGDACLLGVGADSLKSHIDAFVTEQGYRVEKDMDAIIALLTDKMPVRQKTGGVCIRSSSARECSKDTMTNEFYCAYSVCPNIFHFFYMAGISYRQASELAQSISLNTNRGFMRQAYKESLMLHTLVEQKLLPELNELKTEILRKGHDVLIERYPDLEHIISHFDHICEEANAWKDYSVSQTN